MAALAGLSVAAFTAAAHAEESNDPNKPENYQGPRNGVMSGTVQQSDEPHRLIVTDKAGETRHFFPRWIGGMPADGGGFDKAMMSKLAKLKAGDEVEVKWILQERFRVIEVKVTQ